MAVRLKFELEDVILTAAWDGADKWLVNLSDTHAKLNETAIWATNELGAVLFLAAGVAEQDDTKRPDEELCQLMYRIAEPLFKGRKVRPIP